MPLLPARPPLHLVAQCALNDASDKEGWHRGRTATTRGTHPVHLHFTDLQSIRTL